MGKNVPSIFWPIQKCSKIAEYWHEGFVLTVRNITLKFLCWIVLCFREMVYSKHSVFQAASFWRPVVEQKPKETYYHFVERQTGRAFIVYEVKIKSHKS